MSQFSIFNNIYYSPPKPKVQKDLFSESFKGATIDMTRNSNSSYNMESFTFLCGCRREFDISQNDEDIPFSRTPLINPNYYSLWSQDKKAQFNNEYDLISVKNDLEDTTDLVVIQKTILSCLEDFTDISDRQNILLALNELCSEDSLRNINAAFESIDSVKSLTTKVFEVHDVNTLKIADLRKDSEITLRSKKGRTATWKVTGQSGENVTLSKKSGSSRKNIKTKSQAELWSTASNYKEKKGGKMVIEGQSIPLDNRSKVKFGNEKIYDVPFGSFHINVEKRSLGRLGMSKSRSVGDVSITRGKDLKQQKIASGTFKKVVEGSDGNIQYALKKLYIANWSELINAIMEFKLEDKILYSYDGGNRNVISVELKAMPIDHGDTAIMNPEDKKEFIKYAWQELRDLHRQGIIHNDFKTPNVVKEIDGSYKIIDYGLSFGIEQVCFQEANLDKNQIGGTFRPQTFIQEEQTTNTEEINILSEIKITNFNQLTLEAKKSIDLWAFVMCILETVNIYASVDSEKYPHTIRKYAEDKKVRQIEGRRTAESLLREVKELNESSINPFDQIAPGLGSKIEAFLTLCYNEKGEVIKNNGRSLLNSSGQYDIPNEHWDFDSWEGVLSRI